MLFQAKEIGLLSLLVVVFVVTVVNAAAIVDRSLLNAYAPYATFCPTNSLIRQADSISPYEAEYIANRKPKADAALAKWLKNIHPGFSTASLPSVALALSGGGFRAVLVEAGIIQALDARDSHGSMSGLLDSFVYEAALSSSAWLLGSIAAANWPTITWLKDNIWQTTLGNGLLQPENTSASAVYLQIAADVGAKSAAGYPISLIDVFGRLLGYNLLTGPDGGAATTFYSLTSLPKFGSHDVPFPIITAIGANLDEGQCQFPANATQYEFNPFEFGSWDDGVSAFVQTQYLGTTFNNGAPSSGVCTVGFDNLGLVMGTAANVFAAYCESFQSVAGQLLGVNGTTNQLAILLEELFYSVSKPSLSELFTLIPNPFLGSAKSPNVSSLNQLTLADRGISGQVDPIWPFIRPQRDVSVLFLPDMSGDGANYTESGSTLFASYLEAQAQSLTKMPYIPPTDVFASKNLTTRAQFFGCYEDQALTIIWLPLTSYTYPSNIPTPQLQFNASELEGLIGNGNAMATQNGDAEWPTCVGCAVMKKTGGSLPRECGNCFAKYCYVQ